MPLALIGAAVTGGIAAIAVRGGSPAPAVSAPPPVTTATVTRTDLATTVLTEGSLGDATSAPVVNRLPGTYTELPEPGTAIGFGQVLFRVDNSPVVLMQGGTPAWRPFAAGMTDGPDITELQADLVTLGETGGLFSTPSGHFDTATIDAIDRWQQANGIVATGEIGLGQIVFLPNPVLVGAPNAAPGQPAGVGDKPYGVTTATRVVTVPLNPNLPPVTVGEAVSIVLPTNATTAGKITAVQPAPAAVPSQSSSDTNAAQAASSIATVMPDNPGATGTGTQVPVQVSLTTESVSNVLAVPISALLALAGGGYGVEVVGPSGFHHLVGVSTGVFTGTQVQVSGHGIEPGTKVVVAQ
jgi:hypothetical protein